MPGIQSPSDHPQDKTSLLPLWKNVQAGGDGLPKDAQPNSMLIKIFSAYF